MNCSAEKKKLIEEIGVHFEQVHQLSPLAARIYAIMILCPSNGHTFDEIVSITKASKSTVSTQLNLLLQLKKVTYFTKSGDRKRYFKANQTYLKTTLEDYSQEISAEVELLEKITTFNAKYNKDKFKNHEEYISIFKEYLLHQQENLKNTISQMAKIQENES